MWIENLPNGKFKYIERYKDKFNRTKKVSITLDKNTSRAQNEAQRLLFEKIDKNISKVDTSDVLFWSVKDEWIEILEKTSKPATVRIKEVTLKTASKYIGNDVTLDALTKPLIHNILESIYFEDNLSHSYINILKSAISGIFEYAIKKGYTNSNPTKGISIPKKLETLEERSQKREKYLEQDELKEVIALASERHGNWGRIIEFMALTGLRQGEMFALQVKDFKDNKVEVSGTYDQYTKTKVTTKNKHSERSVTLPIKAIEIIEQTMLDNLRNGRNQNNPDDYIFVTQGGNPFVASTFNKFLRSLNYKKKLSTHIFRHTHIALLTELGIPLKAIMERVGHSEPRTTLAIYSHVTKKITENVINKLNTLEL